MRCSCPPGVAALITCIHTSDRNACIVNVKGKIVDRNKKLLVPWQETSHPPYVAWHVVEWAMHVAARALQANLQPSLAALYELELLARKRAGKTLIEKFVSLHRTVIRIFAHST
jgi:hypothetical protein